MNFQTKGFQFSERAAEDNCFCHLTKIHSSYIMNMESYDIIVKEAESYGYFKH